MSRFASALSVFGASIALTLLGGCSRPAPPAESVRAVKLVSVQPAQPEVETAEYAADIRARTESRLGFRVAGKLVQRPVNVGQAVRAGQLLAVLDPQDYQSAAQAAQAQVAAARTQRDLAAADFQRFRSLREQGFISGAEVERREAVLKAAQAGLEQAQAQAQVQANQASYTRLLADVDGVVVAVEAEPGQVVSAGTPVIRLAQNGPRDAVLAVPEGRIARVRVGMSAQVTLWAEGGATAEQPVWPGQVREVAASADPITRTYAVRVALPETSGAALGATATVRLVPQEAAQTPQAAETAAAVVPANAAVAVTALRLPSSAVWQQGAGSAVWVYDPAAGVVRARSVQMAGFQGQDALVTQGLQPGEEVVVAGTHVLSEGQAVVRYAPAPAPTPVAPIPEKR